MNGIKMTKEQSYQNIIALQLKEIEDLKAEILAQNKRLYAKDQKIKDLDQKVELLNRNCNHWKTQHDIVFKRLDELETTVSFNDVQNGEDKLKVFCDSFDRCHNLVRFG